jgi:uncharacterized protein
MNASVTAEKAAILDRKKAVWAVIVFLVIAVAGLIYVKWWPYYNKALSAAAKHTIGGSILTGGTAAVPDPSWASAWSYTTAYYKAVWKAAVLGILLGSLVQVLIPRTWLVSLLGKAGMRSTAIGAAASLPGMMCTCCAAPLAVGMRKQNVSVGAALAFWLGNPVLNPATLIFMGFVLSWKFAALRVVFGLLLVLGVSYWANRYANDAAVPQDIMKEAAPQPTPADQAPLWQRWLKTVWSLTLQVVPAYLLAVLLLGAFRAWMFPQLGEATASGLLAILGFAVAGMLFVIPTAAEIPIIQAMMKQGLGLGPAGALLVTLPAVSLPSLLMIAKAFPRRVIVFVAAAVVVLGILSGLAAMWLL